MHPVYSASKGMVEVLPLLNLPSGEVELAPFKISINAPSAECDGIVPEALLH